MSKLLIVSLVVSLIYSVYMIIVSPSTIDVSNENTKLKSEYVLMVVQCMLGIIVYFLPSILAKSLKLEIPGKMYLAYIVFLYCAIYLGEVQSFYYLIPHWDTIMHGASAAMWGSLGFSLIVMLNDRDDIGLKLDPLFCAIFAFCFAAAIGALWEVYEFTIDGLMNTNMQKFLLQNGEPLVGRSALSDTMKDVIVDIFGALIMSIIGFLSLQKKSEWLEKFKFKKINKKTNDN